MSHQLTCLGADSNECPIIILHEQRLFMVFPKAFKLFLILVGGSCSERWFIDRKYDYKFTSINLQKTDRTK